MTMTMTEIAGPETDRSCSRDRSWDHYKDDYRKENYWESQNMKHRIRHRDYYGDTCDDRYLDNCRNTYKDSYRDKHRDDSFNSDRGRSRGKHCPHNARKDNGFVSNNPRIEQLHKVLQQLGPDKVVAIRFILASSINFEDMFDSIHSPENVDHLIAERIEYVKNQEVENLADKNSSSTDSQIHVNYINHVIDELIDSVKDEKDTCLTQDSQEDFLIL